MNEAETCRAYVVPALRAAGWDEEPHRIVEQRTFTDGRIRVHGQAARREEGKRADYLLQYTPDYTVAVVEAKPDHMLASDGLQQAKEYAEILGLKFAYATNGQEIVEFDGLTGWEKPLTQYPAPEDLFLRLQAADRLPDDARLLTPSFTRTGIRIRYYQEIAINRALEAVLSGKRRVLLTMATGTGKTMVAFQICWKLWSARWNRAGNDRRPKILYLADRHFLVDRPKDNVFAPFEDARWKIENGAISQGREMYFAIYQSIARDENRPGLYREYPPDFFDLVIVDECHRGSAREDSNWREILDYFAPAYQLGMTATPLREDNRDTYLYFGNPVYTYSLAQGIQDGFLAPYRVHRVISHYDAVGWRPDPGEMDRYHRLIPDEKYETQDFERIVSLLARTKAMARHLTDFMRQNDRFAKTIVFCVDQEHADAMRRELNNLNSDLVREYSDYVCRVTADEGQIGIGHLNRFQDVETKTPVILTTSQLLTTGVDVPTCKNIALARVIYSMTDFKQIIGRGTRVRDDYGKLFFDILDYTGSATRLFADPDFDGEPALVTEQEIDEAGLVIDEESRGESTPQVADPPGAGLTPAQQPQHPPKPKHGKRQKYYIDRGYVEIDAHLVYEMDPSGKQLRVVAYSDYTAETVRTLYSSAADLKAKWSDPLQRSEIIALLAGRGIDFGHLAEVTGQPEADPFDLLCYIAFHTPLRTRRERANQLRNARKDFFAQYGPTARAILEELLEKYTEHGTAQFALPDILHIRPISDHGNVIEIAKSFGGPEKLKDAVERLQTLLYTN